jgi:hypothetical protein
MNDILQILNSFHTELKEIKTSLDKITKPVPCHLAGTWLDSQDVLLLLHISKRSLQKLRDNRTLSFSRINGKFYYKVADIQELLERNYTRCHGSNHVKST